MVPHKDPFFLRFCRGIQRWIRCFRYIL